MKLHILFGHRAERYPGEYAPEPLLCWSQCEIDDNPAGFEEDVERIVATQGKDFAVTRMFVVNVDEDQIVRRMREPSEINGELL